LVVGHFKDRSFLATKNRSAVMPKTAGISSSASQNSDAAQFVSIALFSGGGLLASLIVVLLRMHGVF
jgi:hypothetical protein